MSQHLHKSTISHLHHELRNPLTVISSYAQLIQRRAVVSGDAQIERGALAIAWSAGRLTDMLRAVTDVMKIEDDSLIFSEDLVEIQPIMEKAFAEVQTLFNKHVFSLHGSCDAKAMVDPVKLQEAFLAILDNAAKFSPDSSPVEVFLEKSAAYLTISIRDRGVGIPPEVLEKVPQPFFQGDASSPLRLSGLGLGLFLAKTAITHFGGTLVVSSAEPGTFVEISLPIHD